MAHELAQLNGKYTMAYAGQTPWHGLGTQMPNLMTAKEVLTAANLDRLVVKEPVLFNKSDGTVGASDRHFVTRYAGEDQVLGVVSDDYHIVQNEDAFKVFDPIIDREKAVYETAGALGNGSLVWVLAKLPEEVEIAGDSPITQYMLFVNTHDASRRVSVVLTNVRVVCQNTMRAALADNLVSWACRHSSNVTDRLSQAASDFGLSIKAQTESWLSESSFLMSKMVTVESLSKFFDRVARPIQASADDLQKPLSPAGARWVESLNAAYAVEEERGLKSRGTWWAAYNAVTDAVDHSGNGLRGGADTRMRSLVFGELGRKKDHALSVAMAMAAN